MKTRKARRKGGNRTTEYYPLRGFKYTNPTSSTLNLNLYSKQVGGSTCEEKQERYCKKSCKKLCKYVERLPRQDYLNKLTTEKALLKAEFEQLDRKNKVLDKMAKTQQLNIIHPQIRPKGWVGGFEWFDSPANENCTKSCEKSCDKNKTEICKNAHKYSHKTELHDEIELLKGEINKLKLSIEIFEYHGLKTPATA
jgi:hypothetical protein